MYRKILVPLDGSKRAEAIMPHVEELARRYEAEVILLQVVEPVLNTFGPGGTIQSYEPQLLEQLIKNAKEYIAAVKGELREKGIPVRSLVTTGLVVATILDVAKSEDADLIAMASHGRSGLGRVFYGSVAAGVLHGVDRPLLLVRATTPE